VSSAATPVRLLVIGAATAVMVALVLFLGQRLLEGAGPAEPGGGRIVPADAPIAAEADVFRMSPGDLAAGPAGERRASSHPRTLASFRRLRAYPGAPPRIPHGLSGEEQRGGTCNTCHERGGYSPRFGGYAPVTPHPEYASCQQCHVADARVVGTPPRDGSPDALCAQCHTMGAVEPAPAASSWRPLAWPRTGNGVLPGSPPAIPHGFTLRGNCLACHAGPGSVEEIRTTHPERANCRQCHVPAEPEPVQLAGGSRPAGAPCPRGDR
jgi:nitrate reductase (cytochrome), electron transfer subunit